MPEVEETSVVTGASDLIVRIRCTGVGRLMRNVSERDQQLYDYGRSGYRLAASVTVPGSDVVTVIDTLTRESDSDGDGR